MPDDNTRKIPRDSARISLHDPNEVSYWCSVFQCAEHDLRRAVAAVGDPVDAVGNWIRQLKSSRQIQQRRSQGWER